MNVPLTGEEALRWAAEAAQEAERDELRAEIEMLRVVAEAFRAWTLASPNTVGESDALTQACDALSAYDAERVKRGAR